VIGTLQPVDQMKLKELERNASRRLALPLIIRRSDSLIETMLSEGEQLRLADLSGERRKRDWLIGRNALKQVLQALSLDTDTSMIIFPNRQVSLTHSGSLSFATGTSEPLSGIGIDYEPARSLNPLIARWFLRDDECRWVEKSSDRAETLLRWWTIKEAAFKSHPENADMVLKDFVILDLDVKVVRVATVDGNSRIQVFSHRLASGWLSIAVCRESG
jgi:4'-phosphopantetheinyl transferase EntD